MRLLISVFFISSLFHLFSQERNDIIQQRIEFIAEQSGAEEIDLTTLFDQLNQYYDHPINLNYTNADELEQLGLLTSVQIKDVLFHIEVNGKLISIYELQSLKYWDLNTIQRVLPFVIVDDKLDQIHVDFKEMVKNAKFESFVRFQTISQAKQGYTIPDTVPSTSNTHYLGDKNHYYTRLRYSYKTNFSVGLTADKDPGEQFFKGSNSNGFDFYSFHAFYKGGKYVRSIAIGDYQIQIGQGLNVWSGFAFGKTADAMNVKKSANPIRPYTSTDESIFFRGAAIDLGYKRCSMTLFASQKKVDGAVSNDTLSNNLDFASAVYQSGLHRTPTEIATKNSFIEKIIGSTVRYKYKNLQIGISGIYQSYNRPFSKDILPYNQFDFRGKDLFSTGLDYNWIHRNLNFFGEFVQTSISGSHAQVHGVLIAIDPRFSVSVVYRDYSKSYHTFQNAGFSEGGKTQNERGLYFGTKIKVNNTLMLNCYLDYFQFPWLKYQVSAPSYGNEVLMQLTYKPSKQVEIYGRFRTQFRQKNSRDSDGTVRPIEDVLQKNVRFNLVFKATENITLKSRIEYVSIERPSNLPESGIVMIQDLQFQPLSKPFDLSLRYAIFQTDSYDTRIYSYESNALYVFSIPSYYYQGSRAYFLLRYTFFRKLDVWLKYGTTIYMNRKSIGTGPETINGNVKSDLTVEVRMNL